jgi:hypothetical protein
VKILSDQGTPVPLRQALASHSVMTAYEMGWSDLANGDLLGAAEAQPFEVLLTTDKNLRYQQNLTGRTIAIFGLPFASWPCLQTHAAGMAQAITALAPGDVRELPTALASVCRADDRLVKAQTDGSRG